MSSCLLWGAPSGDHVGSVGNLVAGGVVFEQGSLVPAPESGAVDSGDPLVDFDPLLPGIQPVPDTDIAGNPRVVGSRIDRGAYEVQGQ